MPLDELRPPAADARPPRSPGRLRTARPRVAALSATTLVLASVFGTVAAGPASAVVPCADGTTPAQNTTVTCAVAGTATLTVPAGTTSVDVDIIGAGGGAGYPARQHIGGNAAEITGSLSLPSGTAYLNVVVGTGGTGDNHGTSSGGGASAILAQDSGHNLLAKLAVAGAGGGGAYNGDGGNAGSAGTSDNAQAVSGPGQPGVGATGGAGGTGNFMPGTAGENNNPAAQTVAGGGAGGSMLGGAYGGGGGGGYAGGGGGGASQGNFILLSNVAGGGGGSSLASAYLGSASIAIAPNTGGVQQPGLVAGDGATGSVTLTFNGQSVPGAPTAVTSTPGDTQASVSFAAPADNGSAITSYTVTASPGGATATCPGSPCVVTGLTNGTAYTFTVTATNDNGTSPASSTSAPATPATPPGAPTAVTAVGAPGSSLVSWTAPVLDGGSAITGYTVTASPGGATTDCLASPCLVTGLDNGTDYTFAVVAKNLVGSSVLSDPSGSTIVRTVPDAPSIDTLSHGNGSATVTFDAPGEDGGSPITGYTLVASPGGASVNCSGSPCTLTGLTNGTSYTLRLLAINAAGLSELSQAVGPVVPATLPDAPVSLAVDRGDGEAALSFDAPDNDGGAQITRFEVSTDGGTTWDDLVVDGSGPYTATVTGLSNGNEYAIAVRAVNAVGHGAATVVSTITPAGTPGIPSGVSAARGDGQVSVSWTSPIDNGSTILGYQVEVDGGRLIDCPASPCTIEGLTNGTSYQFRVRALNDVGRSLWSTLTDVVVPATKPKAPALVDLSSGDGSLLVRFTPVGNADDGGDLVTGYEYSLDGDSWQNLSTGTFGPSDDHFGVIDGLENGTSYALRVRAVNGIGSGLASDALSQTPATVPGTPRTVEVSSSSGRTTVSWKAPTTDGGSPITGYTVTANPGGTQCVTTDASARSCTFTDLTVGTTYEFAVTAVNTVLKRTGTGISLPAGSGPVLITDVPSALAQLSIVPGDRTAALTFTVPSSDGGKPITGYEVSVDGGDHWREVATTALAGSSTERTTKLVALLNGTTYPIAVRARNVAGAGVSSPVSSTYLQPWFTDPISATDRAKEVPVPKKPSSYKGKLARTVATNRAHDGTVAANASGLKGRQLQPGQAVQLTDKVFSHGSSKLSSGGKKLLKSIAPSLTYVETISCEGYTNYGTSAKTKKKLTNLSKARATNVCTALRSYAKQVQLGAKVGYGGERPTLVGGKSAKRADNRRIVVVIDR